MKVRATGVYIEDGKLLLIKQLVNADRGYSLPGGTLEENETLEHCLIRELQEETGLEVRIKRLLYVCDHITEDKHVLHITFEVEKTGGSLIGPVTGLDTVPIEKVEMVPFSEIEERGLSEKFASLIRSGFPDAGRYMGAKKNIGL